ncbi:MAG: DUF4338 domain-containing protein [Gammaproteobacteria bacterium]|jgi:hypothetical protein|nr:DUF4338 domain-containing protein [Gammaproteobacteria bacterium]|tara:strand:+ start:283 stop:1185 length:903 start_codon:yes stop_codon:yes gene_type:complete
MTENNAFALMQGGRRISEQEIEQICETVELFPRLALKELVATICEHLGWYTPAGGLKENACEKLLRKLETRGMLKLPAKLKRGGGPRAKIVLTEKTAPGSQITASLTALGPVALEAVQGPQKRLWNEYVQRYHPLGYKQPFGYRMRYFINSGKGPLGCLLLCGAAKELGSRERWIGWSTEQRLGRLPWVVNLSRHLIFPWVQVRNLSSYVLAKLARRIGSDWQWYWSFRPVLMESFVDPRHAGSSYKAAGWQYLGMTTGEGLVRKGRTYTTNPKRIFVKPLCEDFRSVLCSELPIVRGTE